MSSSTSTTTKPTLPTVITEQVAVVVDAVVAPAVAPAAVAPKSDQIVTNEIEIVKNTIESPSNVFYKGYT